jgi:cytochrome c biogenesis protein
VQGTIGGSTELARGQGDGAQKMTLEYTGLRVMNVENLAGTSGSGADVRKVDLRASLEAGTGAANKSGTKKTLRNVGPQHHLQAARRRGPGARVPQLHAAHGAGGWRSGVPARDARHAAEGFRYLRIPADENGALDGFTRLRATLADPAAREAAVRNYARSATDPTRPELAQQLAVSSARALALFAGAEAAAGKAAGGLQAVSEFIDTNVRRPSGRGRAKSWCAS